MSETRVKHIPQSPSARWCQPPPHKMLAYLLLHNIVARIRRSFKISPCRYCFCDISFHNLLFCNCFTATPNQQWLSSHAETIVFNNNGGLWVVPYPSLQLCCYYFSSKLQQHLQHQTTMILQWHCKRYVFGFGMYILPMWTCVDCLRLGDRGSSKIRFKIHVWVHLIFWCSSPLFPFSFDI